MPIHLKRLRVLRLEKGLTAKEVAEQLGIRPARYLMYERGDREMPAEILIAFVRLFDTSADYLTELSDDPEPYPK